MSNRVVSFKYLLLHFNVGICYLATLLHVLLRALMSKEFVQNVWFGLVKLFRACSCERCDGNLPRWGFFIPSLYKCFTSKSISSRIPRRSPTGRHLELTNNAVNRFFTLTVSQQRRNKVFIWKKDILFGAGSRLLNPRMLGEMERKTSRLYLNTRENFSIICLAGCWQSAIIKGMAACRS